MILKIAALLTGFVIDCIFGDPHYPFHPIILIGHLISLCEKIFRKLFGKSKAGEIIAGIFIWIVTCTVSFAVPFLILHFAGKLSPYFRLFLESIMCWQIIAARSLKKESMKVFSELDSDNPDRLVKARLALSMIVGRDTEKLSEEEVVKGAVETVAENTSDGVIAPLIFTAIGGAPLGFLYKAVNTMDSMLGYNHEPYKNVGLIPAKMDDIFNFIPARVSAIMMLLSGYLLRLSARDGWKIFKRDRYNSPSPNSGQSESVCAGLLGIRLGGGATYHGVYHDKKYIGDDTRKAVAKDIKTANSLMYMSSVFVLAIICDVTAFSILMRILL